MPSRRALRLALLAAVTAFMLALRYPFVQGPTGDDSFLYLAFAQTTNSRGFMAWLAHPSSLWGLWPTTTPSGGLLTLATLAQATGLSETETALLLPPLTALMGGFGAFLWVGTLTRSLTARFGAALLFATLPRLLFTGYWTFSLRFLLSATLPVWLYLVSALLVDGRAARHPARHLLLAGWLGLLLPSLHRTGLTLPLLLVAGLVALGVGAWQQRSLAPRWFGRLAGVIFGLLVFYLAALAMLGYTPYSPDSFTFTYYLFHSQAPLYRALNVGLYYMLTLGPLLLLALLGTGRLLTQGRLRAGHWLALTGVAAFVPLAQDTVYMIHLLSPLLVAAGALGLAYLGRDLAWRPLARVSVVCGLVVAGAAFSTVMVQDRYTVNQHLATGFSLELQPDLADAANYLHFTTPEGASISVNDHKFKARLLPYSYRPLVSNRYAGLAHLRGELDPASLELDPVDWSTLYLEQRDHLWEADNLAGYYNSTSDLARNRSLSLVNNHFPYKMGQSSSPDSLYSSAHYRWLGVVNYALFANELTTLYYSYGYDRGGG